MSKQINLGKVKGSDATINGVNALTIQANNGVSGVQNGNTFTISAPALADHTGNTSNPHAVTKTQIGLGNVDNKSAATLKSEIMTKDNVIAALGYTPPQQDTVTEVDTAMSDSSANPAQNKVVKAYVDAAKSALTTEINKKMDSVSGTPSQVIGFDENGKPVARSVDFTVYGFELDNAESNPASKIRYIEGNSNFAPAKMVFQKSEDVDTSYFDYGDWEKAWFIQGIRPVFMGFDGTVLEELSKDDYTKTVEGTESSVTNVNAAGNVMIGIPTVWIKVDNAVPGKPKYYFASTQIDSSYHAYAHTDENGNVMPYAYIAAYNGWVDTNNRLRSISGQNPTRSQSGTVQIQEAEANNPEGSHMWNISVLSDRQLITLLLMLIGKSTNTQLVFGKGNMNGYSNHAEGSDENGVVPTGTMDKCGLFFGYEANNLAVKVFGIENLWGNIWDRTAGLIMIDKAMYAKMTYGTQDGSTVVGYNTTGAGYVDLGITLTGGNDNTTYFDGYIGSMRATKFGLFMDSLDGGSDSTQYCDYGWYSVSGVRYSIFGNHSNSNAACGICACYLYFDDSYSISFIGARLSSKPAV